jgi:hypothetical protein
MQVEVIDEILEIEMFFYLQAFICNDISWNIIPSSSIPSGL